MPEAGYLPIPKKIAQKGVKDMVRLSDARMSGTAFGTIVLHVAPESAVGGPLGAVQNGDRIRLSVKEKSIRLLVDEAEIARRLASGRSPFRRSAAIRRFTPAPSSRRRRGAILTSSQASMDPDRTSSD